MNPWDELATLLLIAFVGALLIGLSAARRLTTMHR